VINGEGSGGYAWASKNEVGGEIVVFGRIILELSKTFVVVVQNRWTQADKWDSCKMWVDLNLGENCFQFFLIL
jgi:hypothetical protein